MSYPTGHRGTSEERFWKKVDKAEECWEWLGAQDKKGCGRFRVSPEIGTKLAHHVALWLVDGEWPEGVVMHTCDNSSCVRPEHLIGGATPAENNKDMSSKGRNWQQRKQHCPQGHPYDDANTLISKQGRRRCLTCKREEGRMYQARKRQERRNAN